LKSSRSRKVMQVQSAADPPKKILLGERAVMPTQRLQSGAAQDQGKPSEVVYATEGSP